MFFPFSTDAPIYHWPFATVSIIVVNVLVFLFTTVQVAFGNMDPDSFEALILEFDKINPLQWITGSFMHEDLFHLLGNMLFLWTFGLVVEGKIGSLKFAGIYFLITLIDGAAVQIPMYVISGESGALGASGVIFGLMMIAVIWAPENEMDCFYWIIVFVGTIEVRIIALGVAFVFLQLAFLFATGFSMSSEMLHMIGAAIGAPIGFFMLRQGMVDCEGWDIVSRSFLRGMPLFSSSALRNQKSRQETEVADPVSEALKLSGTSQQGTSPQTRSPKSKTAQSPAAETKKKKKTSSRLRNFATPQSQQTAEPEPDASQHPEFNRLSFVLRQSIQNKNRATAEQTFLQIDQLKLVSGLGTQTLFQYVALLGSERKYSDTLRPLTVIAGRGGPDADKARLKIAMVQLRVLKKPNIAIPVLQAIGSDENADPEILAKRDQLLEQAKRAAP